MPICDRCGEEIEFRYVGGRPTPIHDTGWCKGYQGGSGGKSSSPFKSSESYVNPNAHCPVCGDRVFFYRSPFGGRVFFNDLGWPWPKHDCTDNPQSQSGIVRSAAPGRLTTFRAKNGEGVQLYKLDAVEEDGPDLNLKFCKLNERVIFICSIPLARLVELDVTVKDLRSAPSFVVRTRDDHRLVEFISGRKKRIESIAVPRLKAAN